MLTCPKCGKKTFIKFVYNSSNKFVDENNGYCKRGKYCVNNSVQCTNKIKFHVFTFTIPGYHVEDALNNGYEKTNFAKYLILHLKKDAFELLKKYYVGSLFEKNSDYNIFWKIDNNFVVRSGVCTLYNEQFGYRLSTSSMEKELEDDNRVISFANCFFGAHLINLYPEKDIAIVEDEKTAIISSHFWPEYNWLATGDIDLLYWHEYSIYNILINKQVVIFTEHEYPLINSKLSFSVCQEIVEYLSNEITCNIKIRSLFVDKIKKLDLDSQDLIRALLNYPYEF